MAKLFSTLAILLVVLPALIAASACRISVSSRLSESQGRYNLYQATITNVGSAAAANVDIEPSDDLRSVSGLKESRNSYSLPTSLVNQGGLAVGATYTFTYTVSNGRNIRFDASCTDGASAPATSSPTATKAATWPPTTRPGATNGATTKPATSAPATKTPTNGPVATKAPTAAPATKSPTNGPVATKAPTARPATAAPVATKAPTTKPATSGSATTTKAPTKPATGGNGKLCPAGTVWSPAPLTTWQWQLNGAIDQNVNAQMFDIDLFDNTAATISALHAKGKAVICYFSTQYEDWRPDASSFSSAVLGKNLDDWAGEKWVDIRSSVVRNIFTARLDIAVSKGCDGVEPDNVDSYSISSGFPLTAADQLNFNRFMATEAHKRGLSIGLKNDVDQAAALLPSFDWALNEECNQYSECGGYSVFTNAGKAVFNAEYSGSASSVCPKMVTSKISSLIKNLNLDAAIKAQCCTYQSGGCAAVPHSCKAVSAKRDAEEENNNTVYAAQALETLELTTQEVPTPVANTATTSFASIAFVAVAVVAAMNL